MTDEMKPVKCGCGGESVIYVTHWWGKCYVCECEECGTASRPCTTENEAITAWNKAMGERTGVMTTHEVACLLADIFDDACACNYNGIDEWLPEKCELQDACPHPVGVACWEQFLKWRGDR